MFLWAEREYFTFDFILFQRLAIQKEQDRERICVPLISSVNISGVPGIVRKVVWNEQKLTPQIKILYLRRVNVLNAHFNVNTWNHIRYGTRGKSVMLYIA